MVNANLVLKSLSALNRRVDVPAAAAAGAIAVTAYTVVMDGQRNLSGSRVDDLILVGRPFVPDNPELARPVGALVHLANGVVIGTVYALIAHSHLPGPAWLRGMTFISIENAALYPLTKFGKAFHPAMKDGQLDDYWSLPAFVESWLPHLVFGALVGPLYDRFRRR